MPARHDTPSRYAYRTALAIALLAFGVPVVGAHPFVFEEMPDDFDGLDNAWGPTHNATAADFNGNGSPSWYAGGDMVAHQTVPNPLHPYRYVSAALPTVSLDVCGVCTPYGMAFAVADVNRDGHPDIVRWMGWTGHAH